MAQELRSLNLRSTQVAATQDVKQPATAKQRSSYEGTVIRPPKRPRVHRPRYLDLEATQPPPGGSNKHSTGEPSLEQSPQQRKTIEKDFEDEVPTIPLGTNIDLDIATKQLVDHDQSSAIYASKRTLWKQLQRIFKQT
jgi:hypothetical protein